MMITNNTMGLYVHIPFCRQKCKYCDFLSFAGCGNEIQGRYMNALFSEIKFFGRKINKPVSSIFIGGGTPSEIDGNLIAELMRKIKESFNVMINAEITIESNPGTLTSQKLEIYRKSGINRLSMGVQSFDDGYLNSLGRIHTADEAISNFLEARKAGFDNINIDLMFAIPGHTKETWKKTLEKAVGLNPEHISFYSLQLEESTEFFRMFEDGKLDLVNDELDREMYHSAVQLLKNHGYEHYEISNAAKPGYECKHNIKYWEFEEYLGLGLGASSFMESCSIADVSLGADEVIEKSEVPKRRYVRTVNKKNIHDYCKTWEICANEEISCENCNNIDNMYEDVALNSNADNAFEYVFTALRKTNGVDFNDFKAKTGLDFKEIYIDKFSQIEEWEKQGFIKTDKQGFRLTEAGIDISNTIMAEFAE